MKIACNLLRWTVSIVLSLIFAFLFVAIVGALIPIWLMIAINGREGVLHAPGHGSAILYVTLPLALIVSLLITPVVTLHLSERFRRKVV